MGPHELGQKIQVISYKGHQIQQTSVQQTKWFMVLWLQDLRVNQVKEPCIGLTQENSIKNSVQDCLSYILIVHGTCSTTLAYPK